MSVTHLHVVNDDTTEITVDLNALYAIKERMYQALIVQDWSELKCLDRVCERIVNRLCMKDHAYMKKVMGQLSEIKQIYKMALEEMHPVKNKTPLKAV